MQWADSGKVIWDLSKLPSDESSSGACVCTYRTALVMNTWFACLMCILGVMWKEFENMQKWSEEGYEFCLFCHVLMIEKLKLNL